MSQILVIDDDEKLNDLLADEFVEIGSSGRIFDKRKIMEELAGERLQEKILIRDFEARGLAGDLALVTYKSSCGGRQALRSSIWKRTEGRWQMVFHQGTPASAGK